MFCSHVHDNPYEREHGLLSQWRGYGREGRYALVFDTKQLSELLKSEEQQFRYPHLVLADVVYNDSDLDFPEKFKPLIDVLETAFWHTIFERKEDSEAVSWPLFNSLMNGMIRFKHRGFRE